MRFLFACCALSLLSLTAACSVETTTSEPSRDDRSPLPAADQTAKPPTQQTTGTPVNQKQPAPVEDDTHAEVVYVLMRDTFEQRWFCTGTLVSKDRVVTAAHCLDDEKFISWEIVAPLAAGKPRVSATTPKTFGGSPEDVANPDIGYLTLSKDIVIPAYAELTDVVAQVESGAKVEATAVVRTDKLPEAPLFTEATMTVESTVKYGYEHGFGTKMFSKGGDSGAGLFLVENGKITHKLIGVARQPEPERDLDHFTRVDAAFLAWYQ